MKILFVRNKTILVTGIVLLIISAGEIVTDKMWGDGDGMLTNHNLHKYIFTVQVILVYFLFFKLINRFYVVFFREKISAKNFLQTGGKIFFIMAFLISFFLVLEITSRYFFPSEGAFDRLYPAENARKPFPYMMFKGASGTATGFGKEIYNEHGYRGDYPQTPKDTNEFRIIFSGGSAAWEGEPSIPLLLEEEFKKNNFRNVRVYNFGVVSSVSSMELSVIINEIIDLSPDLLVLYDGANDITAPLKYDPRPGYPFNFLVYENNPFFMRSYPALSLFLYKSNLIRLLARKYFTEKFSRISELKKNAEYGSDRWRNEIADIYAGNLKKGSAICNAYHSEFYTFLQPMVYFKKYQSGEEQAFVNAHQEESAHSLLLKNLILQKINFAKNDSAGFYFKDLTDAYNADTSTVFRDDVHTLQQAKPFIAKAIFSELVKKINFTE